MGSLEQKFDQPGFDHEWFLLNTFYLGQILLITRCYQLALASQFFGDSSSMFERDYLVTGYFSGPLFIGRIRVCLSKPVLVHNYIMMVACRRRWQRPNYCGSCQGDMRDRSFSYSRRYSGGMFNKLWFIVWNIIIILCIKTCFRFAPMLIFYVIGTHMLVESFFVFMYERHIDANGDILFEC